MSKVFGAMANIKSKLVSLAQEVRFSCEKITLKTHSGVPLDFNENQWIAFEQEEPNDQTQQPTQREEKMNEEERRQKGTKEEAMTEKTRGLPALEPSSRRAVQSGREVYHRLIQTLRKIEKKPMNKQLEVHWEKPEVNKEKLGRILVENEKLVRKNPEGNNGNRRKETIGIVRVIKETKKFKLDSWYSSSSPMERWQMDLRPVKVKDGSPMPIYFVTTSSDEEKSQNHFKKEKTRDSLLIKRLETKGPLARSHNVKNFPKSLLKNSEKRELIKGPGESSSQFQQQPPLAPEKQNHKNTVPHKSVKCALPRQESIGARETTQIQEKKEENPQRLKNMFVLPQQNQRNQKSSVTSLGSFTTRTPSANFRSETVADHHVKMIPKAKKADGKGDEYTSEEDDEDSEFPSSKSTHSQNSVYGDGNLEESMVHHRGDWGPVVFGSEDNKEEIKETLESFDFFKRSRYEVEVDWSKKSSAQKTEDSMGFVGSNLQLKRADFEKDKEWTHEAPQNKEQRKVNGGNEVERKAVLVQKKEEKERDHQMTQESKPQEEISSGKTIPQEKHENNQISDGKSDNEKTKENGVIMAFDRLPQNPNEEKEAHNQAGKLNHSKNNEEKISNKPQEPLIQNKLTSETTLEPKTQVTALFNPFLKNLSAENSSDMPKIQSNPVGGNSFLMMAMNQSQNGSAPFILEENLPGKNNEHSMAPVTSNPFLNCVQSPPTNQISGMMSSSLFNQSQGGVTIGSNTNGLFNYGMKSSEAIGTSTGNLMGMNSENTFKEAQGMSSAQTHNKLDFLGNAMTSSASSPFYSSQQAPFQSTLSHLNGSSNFLENKTQPFSPFSGQSQLGIQPSPFGLPSTPFGNNPFFTSASVNIFQISNNSSNPGVAGTSSIFGQVGTSGLSNGGLFQSSSNQGSLFGGSAPRSGGSLMGKNMRIND